MYNVANLEEKIMKRTSISSKSDNHEIRSYFIDNTILFIEFLKDRELNKYIRDKDKEKIRIDRAKTIINACNVGNRILKDRQIDEYERELTSLKQALIFDPENEDIIELSPEKVQEIEDLEHKFEHMKEGEGVSDNGN